MERLVTISVRGSDRQAASEAEARPGLPVPPGATSQRRPKAPDLKRLSVPKSEMVCGVRCVWLFDAFLGILLRKAREGVEYNAVAVEAQRWSFNKQRRSSTWCRGHFGCSLLNASRANGNSGALPRERCAGQMRLAI